MNRGSTGQAQLGLLSNYGFTGSVSLKVSGLPNGTTASISPDPAVLNSYGLYPQLLVNATSAAPAGQYTLIVTGISGSQSQCVPVTLTID